MAIVWISKAKRQGNVLLPIILVDPIYSAFYALVITNTCTHPESRAKCINEVAVDDIGWLLFKLVAVKKIIIVCIQGYFAAYFRRPVPSYMADAKLRPKGKSVLTKIDQLILHVLAGRQTHRQPHSDDGVNIQTRSIIRKLLAAQRRRTVQVHR